ncbi:caspase-3-like [Amphiura filiformis]|uniref:caspase-3-like n=1 Tax=Amphiura filiformis TaxID=82378 RepID=UPI003B225631
MLKRRRPSAYDEFMRALAEFRPDLYDEVKEIENSYTASVSSSSSRQQYQPYAAPQRPAGAFRASNISPGTAPAQQQPHTHMGASSSSHYTFPSHQQPAANMGASSSSRHQTFSSPQQRPAFNMGASSSSTVLLTDTFPPDLSNRINRLCGNNSDSHPGNTQAAAGPSGDHLLNLDAPGVDGMPPLSSISPSELDIPVRGAIPCYQLTRNPRGLALIINNKRFADTPVYDLDFREGSDEDACNLIQLFRSLNFKVHYRNDLSHQEMHDVLDAIRQYDHRQYDAFVCCILTHGQMGEVFGSDSVPIRIEELLGLFNGVKCNSLLGKPKMFFIQACQGRVRQLGVRLPAMDSPPVNAQNMIDTLPIANDYLIGYSTLPGYASYRCEKKGSWYVISLVRHIKDLHDSVDMANVLALVNGHMSRCSVDEGYKQSSPYRSTLTMPLFL